MFTRSVAVNRVPREGYNRSKETLDVQPKQTPKIIHAAAYILLGLTMLVLGVMGVARVGTISQILDPPSAYLPGSPKPKDLSCYTPSDEVIPRCFVHFGDNDVYFSFDSNGSTITRTIIPAGAYTIGQMMVSWGDPTGITWTDYTIYIYWGTRAAMLYAHSIRPDSPVDLIAYEQEPYAGSPWRGFTHHNY